MTRPSVSVVIRCCNEQEHIGRLLCGILEQTVREVEIILVDSGSTDATLAMASRYPVVVRHIKREEFSFGRSLNIGCAAATGEYIVIASAHVYPVYRDWIAKMVEPFADTTVGLVYGKQRGDERTKFSEHRLFEKLYPESVATPAGAYFCNNANSVIRRQLWQAQPFDEALTGLEDLAWAKLAVQQGYRVVYQSDGCVVHVHDESWRQVFNRYRREAIALKQIAPTEKFGFVDFLHCFAGNVLSDLRHAAAEGRLRDEMAGVLGFRLMQFWGTYAGYANSAAVTDNLKQTFYYPKEWAHERDFRGSDERAAMRIPYAAAFDDDES